MEVRNKTRKGKPQTQRSLQLPLSRTARKELRALCTYARKELSPATKAALRTFAVQYGYRPSDVLEALVVLTAVNYGETTSAK
jgi:hypothetical protein